MPTCKENGAGGEGANAALASLSGCVRGTHTPQVLRRGPGSFEGGGIAGLFLLDYPPGILERNYKRPVLVACAGGVGAKLDVAFRTGIADTIGVDLVAACVNSLVAQGADPLFFLDQISVGKGDPRLIAEIVKGIAAGCREAGCSLLKGETAEVPGFYRPGHYGLAGFAVGVVESSRLVLGEHVAPRDQIIGVFSSGLHAGGYSLLRRILTGSKCDSTAAPEKEPAPRRWDLDAVPSGLSEPLGQALLRPTLIYARPLLSVLRFYRTKRVVHALAPVTGGLPGSLARVLPAGVTAVIHTNLWEPPAVFRWVQEAGKVSDREMFRTCNMGIGMVAIVAPYYRDSILAQIHELGCGAAPIGEIAKGRGKVLLKRK